MVNWSDLSGRRRRSVAGLAAGFCLLVAMPSDVDAQVAPSTGLPTFPEMAPPPRVSQDAPTLFRGVSFAPARGSGMTRFGQRYTLAELESLALAGNPTLAAAEASQAAAQGLKEQVGTPPNPTLGYFGQQLADKDTEQNGLFIEQEFVRGGKLALNQAILEGTAAAQAAVLETQQQRVLTDVRLRFYEALAAQQQLNLTRDFLQVVRRGLEIAQARQAAEEGTLIETLQAQTLVSEVTLNAEQAEAAFRGAWRDLAAVANLSSEVDVELDGLLETPLDLPDWEQQYLDILGRSPELSTAQALIREREAAWHRQQVQAIPNVTAQVGGGYDRATQNGMINLQFSAPLPVRNLNRGNISAAHAQYMAAIQEAARVEQSIRSRLARTAQDYERALAAVKKYEIEILPQVQQSLELSERAYEAGELDFLQVLIVRRSYFESSLKTIDAKAELAQANARVQGLLLTGGLDAPADLTSGDGWRGQSFGGQ